MLVRLSNKQKNFPIPTRAIKKIVAAIVAYEVQQSLSHSMGYDEVALHFVSTSVICRLHAQYFNDPAPTDCISFPIDNSQEPEGYRMLGDVFVCPETAMEYAVKKQADPYQELILYVIHGLLHLFGYDDIDPKQRREMRAAERRLQRHLRVLGLLPHV